MALKYEVKDYAAKEELELKDLRGEKHNFAIYVTHEDAEELVKINEDKEKNLDLDVFAKMLFHDNVEEIKKLTGKDYENCVVMVGFQFMNTLFKEKVKYINSMSSMRHALKKK